MRNVYLVVDQNYLRSLNLKDLLASKPKVRIVLADIAFVEMTKTAQRELNVRESLKILAKYADRTFVSRALSELLDYEIREGQAVTSKLLYRDATLFARKLLSAIRTKSTNVELGRVLGDPNGHLAAIKRSHFVHETNRATALELVAETKASMAQDFAKSVRGATATEGELKSFVIAYAPSLLLGILEDKGYSRQRAISFIRRKPMLLRYFYLKTWSCLQSEAMGRLQSMAGLKVSNDLIDQEYVLTATFFDAFLSADANAIKAFQFLTEVLGAYQPAA